MSRIPFRLRVFVALFLSFFVIKILPALLISSPYIPTKDELLHLVYIPSIKQIMAPKVEDKISEQTIPSPTPTNISIVPTVTNETLVIIPTPTDIIFPTQGIVQAPTLFPTQEIIPTIAPVIPTQKITPTSPPIPSPYPTVTPSPSVSPNKTPNYSAINALVANMPQIGCQNNTISGCPVDSLYQTPLEGGIGWATYYGNEHNSGYNVVADVIHNNKRITLEAAHQFINDTYMEKQSNMTPDEAKQTGKVIAFAATRTPKDLWRIKYLFGIDNSKNPQARFIGRIMIIDCAAPNDWKNNLATLSYSYKGWTHLNWIVDLSKNGFIQLPTGLSGRQENTGEGRPGVILIDEASLDSYIH
ncbi:MAG: hypothetical protein V1922_05775 [bacterium]